MEPLENRGSSKLSLTETHRMPQTVTKTLRIRRSTVNAMRMSRPKRRGPKVLVTLCLVLVIVGMVVYWTKGYWWPYWEPKVAQWSGEVEKAVGSGTESSGARSEPAGRTAGRQGAPGEEVYGGADGLVVRRVRRDEGAAGNAEGRAARRTGGVQARPDWSEAPLEYVSAAGWDDEEWLKTVRGFNQALDRYQEAMVAGGTERAVLEKIGRVGQIAGERFARMAQDAPETVDAGYAAAMGRKLASAVAEVLALADRAKAEAEKARAAARAEAAAHTGGAGAELLAEAAAAAQAGQEVDSSVWKAEHDRAAAKFNAALKLYRKFMGGKESEAGLLPQIEELAFEAAKLFEAVRDVSGGTAPRVEESINQCYRLISDCRRQSLEGGNGGDGGASGTGAGKPRSPGGSFLNQRQ